MTQEQIEFRKIIYQMLADSNINQTTLKDMAKTAIDEKVETCIKRVFQNTYGAFDLEEKTNDKINKIIEECVRQEIRLKVRDWFSNITVNIEVNPKGE